MTIYDEFSSIVPSVVAETIEKSGYSAEIKEQILLSASHLAAASGFGLYTTVSLILRIMNDYIGEEEENDVDV